MFADLQSKLVALLAGLILLLVSNMGTYFYGRAIGIDMQKGKQATVEVARAAKGVQTAAAHTGVVVEGVKQDNEKEAKANERYETAMAELRNLRTANRKLISDNGGLRISADICAGRNGTSGEAEAPGASEGDGTTTGTIALPDRINEDLQRRADEADAILEKLRVLRDWAIDQGFAKPEVVPDGPDVEIVY